MEGFTYNNIFDTKGIEYIIILTFLTVLVPFWLFISRDSKAKQKISDTVKILTAGLLKIPQGLFFSKNHTWVHLEKSGEAKIGLDDFLTHAIGKMNINPLKHLGETVSKGEYIAEIIQGDKKLKMCSPISGKITKTNSFNGENENFIKNDPYEKGWLFAVTPDNWKAETSGFYIADEATEWIKNELLRFKDFLNTALVRHSPHPEMLILQEGGELKTDPLEDLQAEIWKDFQKDFLDQ